MRILALAPSLYARTPADGGAALAGGLLRRLSQRHTITVVAFGSRNQSEMAAHKAEMETWAEDVRIVPRGRGALRNLASRLAILRAEPTAAAFSNQSDFRAAIRDSLAENPPDVVLVQFPELAQYVDALGDIPSVMDVQDAYSVSAFRRCLLPQGVIRRIWCYAQWLSWVRYERRHYDAFKRVLTVSDQDNLALRIFNPQLPVITSGVAFDAPELILPQPSTEPTIAFAASFSHRPNIAAIEYFATSILPRVRQRYPQTRFLVAGRSPPDWLIRRYGSSVEFVGFVPDIYKFFQECTVAAIPVVSGGGVKIKTVQALLAGAPVVSTAIGAEGINATDDEHLLVRDGAEPFSDALLTLIERPEKRRALSQAGRAFAIEEFAWAKMIGRVEEALESAAAPERSR